MSADTILHQMWLVPALPLLGAAVLLLFGKRIGEPAAGWFATILVTLSFVVAVILTVTLHAQDSAARTALWDPITWIPSGTFEVKLGLFLDPLSSVFICFVTGVSALIHLYSIGYMHGDERYSRFFAYMNLFVGMMLILVLGSNFVVTFLGWEGVALCSYLLIAFWFERSAAAVAGQKAFVVNRVGDFGFMIAMFLIVANLGTLDYAALGAANGLPQGTATAIALLLLLAAVGKSAQIPLHVWLPDAMEGPTPVSALIHAATMVTAGVYLVARAHAFFVASGGAASTTVAWAGALTALFAASIAIVQNDIKRVLAYSTISQVGYMFLALGVGAYSAAVFLVITHAFFKGTLFLGAGSVIHAMDDNQDIRSMGGLRRFMPYTAFAFIVAWLAIAGIPPLSGFWSKDGILEAVFNVELYPLWAIGVVAALLTAFYMTRETWLVFFGNERFRLEANEEVAERDVDDSPTVGPDDAPHLPTLTGDPREAPSTMTSSALVLAGLAAIAGVIALPFDGIDYLESWLAPVFADSAAIPSSSFAKAFGLDALSVTVAVVGIVIAYLLYRHGLARRDADPLPEKIGSKTVDVLAHAYYLDEGISKLASGPAKTGATFLAEDVERGVIDGAVNGVGSFFKRVGEGLRRVQNGRVRNYALGILLGAAAVLLYLVAWAARP